MGEKVIRVVDQSLNKVVSAKLPDNVPMSKLLPHLVKKIGLPDGGYSAHHWESREEIAGDDTLKSAHIADGDTIRLIPNVIAGGYFPIRSIKDFLLTDAVLSKIQSDQRAAWGSILLYTDWDIPLAQFVWENINELDQLAGQHCNLFVIEEPTDKWLERNQRELPKQIESYFDFLWKRAGWSSSKPYDRSQAIDIARYFGIEPGNLPCIVLFHTGTSKEYILLKLAMVIPSFSENVQEDFKRFFREFFSLTSLSSTYPPEMRLMIFEKLASETYKPRQISNRNEVLKSITEKISLDVSIIDILKIVISAFGLQAVL